MKILNPGKVEAIKKVAKKIEKPKKESTTKKESPATATTTETKIEKPKKETKATTAKGKSTGKKGTK
jgi:hypothetical protein